MRITYAADLLRDRCVPLCTDIYETGSELVTPGESSLVPFQVKVPRRNGRILYVWSDIRQGILLIGALVTPVMIGEKSGPGVAGSVPRVKGGRIAIRPYEDVARSNVIPSVAEGPSQRVSSLRPNSLGLNALPGTKEHHSKRTETRTSLTI